MFVRYPIWTLLAVVSLASASTSTLHQRADIETPSVQYIFPEGRGHSLFDASRIGPCQGLPLGARTKYPISGGMVSLNETRNATDIRILYSASANPSEQGEFVPLTANHTEPSPNGGQSCFAISNLAAIGMEPGQNLTLQLNYQRDGEMFYECADVTLVTTGDFAATSTTVFCGNTNTNSSPEYQSSSSARAAATAAPTACATSTVPPSNTRRLNAVQGGVIGAMATVIVIGILHFLAYLAGAVAYGRTAREGRERLVEDDMTERSVRM